MLLVYIQMMLAVNSGMFVQPLRADDVDSSSCFKGDSQICLDSCCCTGCQSNTETDTNLVVDCSHRNLRSIPVELPLHITQFNLSHNQLEDLTTDLHTSWFKTLTMLDLSFNQLTVSGIQAFLDNYQLDKLGNLDVTGNLIESFPRNIKNVVELKMINNSVDFVSLKTVSQSSVRRLNLQGNHISSLPGSCKDSDMEDTDSKVEILDLSSNKISSVEDCALSTLTRLKLISLADNQIETIPQSLFRDTVDLVTIDLSRNYLYDLPEGLFEPLLFLKHLILSGNHLTTLPESVPVLSWLDISFNKIEHIPEELQTVLYPQEVFLLGGNPFICDCSLLWLKELYDVREYLLKFIHVDREKFIPKCAAPAELKEETWDVLGDEMFKCSSNAEKDFKETGEEWKEVIHPKEQLWADMVSSTFVRLRWENQPKGDNSVYITYHPFGKKHQTKKVLVKEASSVFTVSGLTPRTPYIICKSERSRGTDDTQMDKQCCIEIVTHQDSSVEIDESRNWTVFSKIYQYTSSFIVCLASIICLFWALKFLGVVSFEDQ